MSWNLIKFLALLVLCPVGVPLLAQESAQNTLSAAEKQQGWKLLFDGKTLYGWREYRPSKSGKHWVVEDGCLKNPKGTGRPETGGGELLTTEQLTEKSKYKDLPGFGTKFKTAIQIQDHGDEIWFRNIKLRPLS